MEMNELNAQPPAATRGGARGLMDVQTDALKNVIAPGGLAVLYSIRVL